VTELWLSYDWPKIFKEPASGANPTTVSYNANDVKIYNATSSLVRFENRNIFFYILWGNTLGFYAGVVAVNSEIEGLAPEVAFPTWAWNL
jgi:hypothetical protein